MFTSLRRYKAGCAADLRRRVRPNAWNCFAVLMLVLAAGALQQARAGVGDRIRIGQAGDWRNTIAAVTVNNRLYTIETSGSLYVTDLSSGTWKKLGNSDFANTRFLFAVGQYLYTIETSGSLYRINQTDGSWSYLPGKAGQWKGTIAGATLNGRIYTVENSGALYETNPADGAWKQVGKAEFGNTRHMFSASGSLYTIEAGGLYRVSPSSGSWSRVGAAEDWSGTLAVAAIGGRLYSANKDGSLYLSQLSTGQWVATGKSVFGNTAFMFENANRLYSIDSDGSLYMIET
ncbi:MAG TPA: hypothetical protein VJS44_18650 [Pyrinomonadaceae bacterium]|nr:hypothetical protein [Pyrinomonadaceae bacterium]